MAVAAKVACSFKQQGEGNVLVGFTPDYAQGRNSEWASATPSLSLTMVVKDADLFTLGAKYTLTFDEETGE